MILRSCFLDHSKNPIFSILKKKIKRPPLFLLILTTPHVTKHPHSIIKMETLSSRWLMHTWTAEENKTFESALAFFDQETPDKWFEVAAMIPGKSVNDVVKHYLELVADVNDIEAGLVPIPGYLSSSSSFMLGFDVCGKSRERKKGVPWTEDEHRRFVLGLEKYGKGDWKNISRNFVVSKTPTQVASHAQKYYLRQLSGGKDKRRPSIHDLTVRLNDSSDARLLEKPNEHTSLHNPPHTPDWNHINGDRDLTVFDSSCGDSLIANPSFHYIASCLR